jgi:hypothetical protein
LYARDRAGMGVVAARGSKRLACSESWELHKARSRLAAVHLDAKAFWGNFETEMAAVWIYPTTPHY